jgi:hypothetical protein
MTEKNYKPIPLLSEKDIKRFYSKIAKWWPRSCWLWTAGVFNDSNYGCFIIGTSKSHFTYLAHRIAYFLDTAREPGRLFVCHTCDTPRCVNPAHLFLDTIQGNIADRHAKGRDAKGLTHGTHTKPESIIRGNGHYSRTNPEKLARGERVSTAKLTELQVKDILRSCPPGTRNQSKKAREYGISQATIWHIINGNNWKHIDRNNL